MPTARRSAAGPNAAITALIARLDVEGDAVPRRMARRLAARAEAVPVLIGALADHPRTRVRRWLAEALGFTGDPRALPALRRALGDPAMTVRLHAMIALADLGDPAAGPAILPLLGDASGGIRV